MAKVFFQMVDTLEMGGTERMSINIAAVMAEKGYQSHLIVSRRTGGMSAHIPNAVQVHFLNKKAFYDFGAFIRLTQLKKKYQPNILHAHSTSIYWAVALKIISGKFLLVWHDHFGLSDQLDKFPRKEMLPLLRWTDKIICVNDKLSTYWKSLLPKRKKDIATIKNFPFLIMGSKSERGLFTFLHLANFRSQKNHMNLLEATKILAQKRNDFKILMVGEFVEESIKEQVIATINTDDLQDLVEVHGPENEVSAILNSCQAGILSSDSEGLPVALLEYGLAGLPVVCTDVGDCSKVISSSELGILVSPKDPVALAEGMNTIISDAQKAKSMGEKLKAKILKEYGGEGFFQKYVSLLQVL